MKLAHEFIKLPLQFDIERMQQEVLQLTENDWHQHHEGFKGNIAVPLLSVGGGINNDFKGPICETNVLHKLPYIKQVIASFGEVIGRSRLMALEPGCSVPEHSDINYHWYKRVRIHIPIVTTKDVIFQCHDKQVNMAAGECWIFDSWKNHQVNNGSNIRRIHLVVDTMGSSKFWDLVDKSVLANGEVANTKPMFVPFSPEQQTNLLLEKYNAPVVMNPAELDSLCADLINEVHSNEDNLNSAIDGFSKIINRFCQDWRHLYSLHGEQESGWPYYHKLRDKTYQLARNFDNKLLLINGGSALQMLIHCIIDPALSPEIVEIRKQFEARAKQASSTSAAPIVNKGITSSSSSASNVGANSTAAPVKTNRNSPCDCGSGKKFKHCCGAL